MESKRDIYYLWVHYTTKVNTSVCNCHHNTFPLFNIHLYCVPYAAVLMF